jgi:hypothetical protein
VCLQSDHATFHGTPERGSASLHWDAFGCWLRQAERWKQWQAPDPRATCIPPPEPTALRRPEVHPAPGIAIPTSHEGSKPPVCSCLSLSFHRLPILPLRPAIPPFLLDGSPLAGDHSPVSTLHTAALLCPVHPVQWPVTRNFPIARCRPAYHYCISCIALFNCDIPPVKTLLLSSHLDTLPGPQYMRISWPRF